MRDLMFSGGTIYTLTGSGAGRVPALRVVDGRVAADGAAPRESSGSGRPSVREGSTPGEAGIIDLGEAVLVPAQVDHHVHLLNVGLSLLSSEHGDSLHVDLRDAASRREVVDRVVARAGTTPAGEWIVGKGWSQHDWHENDLPDHRELSAALPQHPVFLGRVDAHCAWVNAAALAAADIGPETADPPGGAIRRDARGRPTGIVLERAAEPFLDRIPPHPGWAVREAFQRACRRFAALGYGRVFDAGFLSHAAIVHLGADLGLFLELLEWADADEPLPVDVSLMVPAPSPLARRIVEDPDRFREITPRLRVTHVKLYADGAFGSRGAALSHPYADDPSTRGVLRMTAREIAAEARRALDAGLDLATHAIGDEAVRQTLDAYQTVLGERSDLAPQRLRVEHFGYASRDDIHRAADLGVLLVAQPSFIVPGPDGVPMEELRLGADACARCYPWRTLLGLGARLAGSSDHFAAPGPALWDLYAAATRRSPAGTPPRGWIPAERLDRLDALRLMTRLWAGGGAAPREGLAPGAPADLAILSADPLRVPEEELLGVRVVATLRDGRVTWHDGSLPGLAGA